MPNAQYLAEDAYLNPFRMTPFSLEQDFMRPDKTNKSPVVFFSN